VLRIWHSGAAVPKCCRMLRTRTLYLQTNCRATAVAKVRTVRALRAAQVAIEDSRDT
jgi:hypothetical protein